MSLFSKNIICHPLQIPVEVAVLHRQVAHQAVLGELLVHYDIPIAVGEEVRLSLFGLSSHAQVDGQVVCADRGENEYLLKISFHSEDDAFRMRMIEQLCYIKLYQHEVYLKEGRLLSEDEAADEWIKQFSEGFPEVTLACH